MVLPTNVPTTISVFLTKLDKLIKGELKKKCEKLEEFYCGDIDSIDLYGKCLQFACYVEAEVNEGSNKNQVTFTSQLHPFLYQVT